MKDEDAFNPAIPANFKLLSQTGAIDSTQQPPGSSADPLAGAQKAKAKSKRSEKRTAGSAGSRKKKKSRISWQHLKEKLNAHLAGVDKQRLKQVLVACGIAGGVVLSIIVAVKMVPIAVLLLALLGLACVIRIWDRLRRWPDPLS
jgi:hypothetical protein